MKHDERGLRRWALIKAAKMGYGEHAEDIAQETVAQQIRAHPGTPDQWWEHRFIDALKAVKPERGQVEEAEPEDDYVIPKDAPENYWRWLGVMEERERIAVVLMYKWGFTLEEITEAMGNTVASVKCLIQRAKKRIGEKL